MSLTLSQRTNIDGWPKAGELIQMTGTHPLEASDRAILNTLYQFAHDARNMAELGAEWEIPLTKLRFSAHQSNDKLYASLQRLRKVEVTITYFDDSEKRIILTGLFDFFDISAKELERRATLRFGLPRKLAPLLARSDRWGRIKAEIICSMTSRYGISLYEAVRLRVNLDRCLEVFPIDRFRELLGVPPGAYENGTNFLNKVITPALLEVNGLSDMGVAVQLNRRHPRAPIDSVTVTWWRKGPDELSAVIAERNRSKLNGSSLQSSLALLLVPGFCPAFRLHAIKKDMEVGWPALYAQFGAGFGFGRLRRFRGHFIECLGLAVAAYPEARIEISERGVVLRA